MKLPGGNSKAMTMPKMNANSKLDQRPIKRHHAQNGSFIPFPPSLANLEPLHGMNRLAMVAHGLELFLIELDSHVQTTLGAFGQHYLDRFIDIRPFAHCPFPPVDINDFFPQWQHS